MTRTEELTRPFLWVVLLCLVFAVYSNSFKQYRVLEKGRDVLADADTSDFSHLIRNFDIFRTYGNEYDIIHGTLGDNVQRHKVLHPLYGFVGNLIYRTFKGVYATFGIPPDDALYAVNASISCINVVLLSSLIFHLNPSGGLFNRFWVLVLYVFSLNPWIYGSIPESWPLSATLVLLFLFILFQTRAGHFSMSAYIGIAMLNNVLLVSLTGFLMLRAVSESKGIKAAAGRVFLCSAVVLGTWLGSLSILSLWDGSLGPGNYIRYSLWLRQYLGGGLPIHDPYVWKVILTNVFVNPILSNQPNPALPRESFLYTMKGSPVGFLATAIYLFFGALTLINILRAAGREYRNGIDIKASLNNKVLQLILFCLSWVLFASCLHYPASFLYATILVPLFMILVGKFVGRDSRFQMAVFYATVSAVVINNVIQIMRFRTALGTLS